MPGYLALSSHFEKEWVCKFILKFVKNAEYEFEKM
jgi:hypothetical protein